jgi:hypothetical protein
VTYIEPAPAPAQEASPEKNSGASLIVRRPWRIVRPKAHDWYALPTRKIKYSTNELALLRALPENGDSITSTDLVRVLYGDDEPFHARSAVSTTMRHLIRKVVANGELFVVCKSVQAGPVASSFWITTGDAS